MIEVKEKTTAWIYCLPSLAFLAVFYYYPVYTKNQYYIFKWDGVNAIFIGSSNELGGFESGLVARLFTPVISVVSGGIATLIVVASWAGLFPRMRRFGSLADATEQNA